MRLKIGTCGVCNNKTIGKEGIRDFIADKDYTEITLVLSNGQRAVHGICRHCLPKLNSNDVKKLFKRIQDTWLDEMYNYPSSVASTRKVQQLDVIGWGVGDNPITIYHIKR